MRFGMECSTKASKTYQKRVMVTTACYMAVLFGAATIVRHGHPVGWHLYFWAITPTVPVIALLVHIGIYLRDEADEYTRMITIRSLLVGTAALMTTLVVSDFLRSFTPTGDLPPFTSFVLFFAAFGLAQGVQQMQNRSGGDD